MSFVSEEISDPMYKTNKKNYENFDFFPLCYPLVVSGGRGEGSRS